MQILYLKNLLLKNITMNILKKLTGIILLGAIAYLLFNSSTSLIGKAPTKKVDLVSEKPQMPTTPEHKIFKEQLDKSDKKIEMLNAYIKNLRQKIKEGGQGMLIVDLIDSLSTIIKLEPSNSTRILELANLSFDMKVFEKSKKLYEDYLKIKPEDTFVKGKYASSLIFTNKSKDAIGILDSILAKEPKNFSALAFKAIALSQVGDITSAKIVGKQAMELTPDEEGKIRFKKFLDSLDKN